MNGGVGFVLREKISAFNQGNLRYIGLITFALLLAGCAIPQGGALIPPVGYTDKQMADDIRECANRVSNTPLTEQENMRVNGVETGRFSQGGRGRNPSSDRTFLCMLDRDYQYIKPPLNWGFSESNCEILESYKSGGIEEKRLRYMCEKSPEDYKCDVCQ